MPSMAVHYDDSVAKVTHPGPLWGVAPGEAVSDDDFKEQRETLNAQARELEATIAQNVAEILES